MALTYHHEVVAPGLHRFVFASESRPGLSHELLLDLETEGPGRLSCLCEASLYGRMCKHKRLVIHGGRRALGFGRRGARWQRGRTPRPRRPHGPP